MVVILEIRRICRRNLVVLEISVLLTRLSCRKLVNWLLGLSLMTKNETLLKLTRKIVKLVKVNRFCSSSLGTLYLVTLPESPGGKVPLRVKLSCSALRRVGSWINTLEEAVG